MQARAFRALGPDSFENVRLYEGRATPSGPRCARPGGLSLLGEQSLEFVDRN